MPKVSSKVASYKKPRGKMSAYAFFVQTCRQEHKKKFPEEIVIFTEFSRKCADRWKTMSDAEKLRFHQMADQDKLRYQTEAEVAPKKKTKRFKDPNAPKRPLSAFFHFSNDERSRVRAANPDFSVGEVGKEMGRMWGEIDPRIRLKYEELSLKDRQRYEKEMIAYRNSHSQENADAANSAEINNSGDSD